MISPLKHLVAGQAIVFGGDRVSTVSDELAAAFRAGDRLVVVQDTGDLLHIPAQEHERVTATVQRAVEAFGRLAACSTDQISALFEEFSLRLADDQVFARIAVANGADLLAAHRRGRSTTRLELTEKMRAEMIAGLQTWRAMPPPDHAPVATVDHGSWEVEARRAPLGVVGFVFEGRPNVFADAVGVLRTGNGVVFRIGSDALGTARAIMTHALEPAVAASGLPEGIVGLVDSVERSAGWALFGDRNLSLAVARGSGAAVAQLGAVARQAGVPVSLHGTGGAWLVADADADHQRFAASVSNSLDRKVCNTVNVCCIVRSAAAELVPVFIKAVRQAAAQRGASARLHVEADSAAYVDAAEFEHQVVIRRAHGDVTEPFASIIPTADLGTEWEWEDAPEVSLVVVEDLDHAVTLCNTYSPRFVVSLIAADPGTHDRFYAAVDAPFVGDGFTRWVDGQYALDTPELGLSNWEGGRLLGRGAILSGDAVHTVRLRARIHDPQLSR
jgi:glutamate-5-semialdehyde dehydrogenase